MDLTTLQGIFRHKRIVMTLKQLESLIKQGESETLEFKKTTGTLKDAMATVCSFLNSKRGGTILIGVKDDGTILGQDVSDETRQELAVEIKKIEPFIMIHVEYMQLKTKKIVIVISVNPDLRAPYMYDGRSFMRVQSTTSRMTNEQYEYIYHKNNPHRWGSFTNNSCTINDLDKTRIKDVIRLGIVHKRIPADAIMFYVKQLQML